MHPQSRRPLVLLVEDDEDHALLTRMAFERAGAPVDVEVARDGVECWAYLTGEGGTAAKRRPDLLLIDLHMPRLDGAELMERIAAHDSLRSLPVVVLTTSEAPADVDRMYQLRVSSYITKPVDFAVFCGVISRLASYWFATVLLPRGPGA